jgi:UDP-glucuronate 4-epimerase
MDECVLVTGADGLIGGAVVAALSSIGRRVVGLLQNGSRQALPFEAYTGDLRDTERMQHLFSEHEIGRVVHSGAVSGPMVGLDDPMRTIMTNILGTANVLEASRCHGVKRFVYLSSTTAYGDTPAGPIAEGMALRPKDVYGATKAAGEALVAAYESQLGLEGVSLRISWVYGPRRTTACLIRTLIEDALADRETRLEYGAGFCRQYVHVDDVVRGILAVLDAPSHRLPAYNLTGGTMETLDAIAGVVKRLLPQARIAMRPGPDPLDTCQGQFDISSMRRDFGFVPRVSLEDGIRSYARWLAANSR